MMQPRVLLFFVDGVGLGADDIRFNPFAVARLPTFAEVLGGAKITAGTASDAALRCGAAASLVAVDAVLGVLGTPQSGTGQATLLTGTDAVALHGGHFGPWVPARLRTLVRQQSVLAQAQRAGFSAAFANAYPEEVAQLPRDVEAALPSNDLASSLPSDDLTSSLPSDDLTYSLPSDDVAAGPAETDSSPHREIRSHSRRRRRAPSFLRAGPPLAALGAGLLTRHTPELVSGQAVASELTNEGWREHLGRQDVPSIDAVHAGQNLARIAAEHDLTLFAHYATDYAGHRQDMEAAVQTLERLDSFLRGLIDAADDDLLIFIASDHGNLEDVRTGHTRNPAIGIVIGRNHRQIASQVRSLRDIAPAIIHALSSRQHM